MARRTTDSPAIRRIASACAHAHDANDLLASVSATLRKLIPYDGSAWFSTDPATILPTVPLRVENIEDRFCAVHWNRECLAPDVLRYRDLARSPVPAGTMLQVTDNHPASSIRYREFLAPQSYGDELRAALRVGHRTWGVMDLYRERGRRPFTTEEVAVLIEVAPVIALALRDAVLRQHEPSAGEASAGTVLFDVDGRVLSYDEQAERRFTELAGAGWANMPPRMSSVEGVRALALGIHEKNADGRPTVRLRTDKGWLTVGAAMLRTPTGGSGPIAVTVQPTRPAEVAPLLTEAYGLTPREQQVTWAATRGLTNRDIANQLALSQHTVGDHLKSVFTKFGVSSRSALAAILYGDLYEPLFDNPPMPVVHATF